MALFNINVQYMNIPSEKKLFYWDNYISLLSDSAESVLEKAEAMCFLDAIDRIINGGASSQEYLSADEIINSEGDDFQELKSLAFLEAVELYLEAANTPSLQGLINYKKLHAEFTNRTFTSDGVLENMTASFMFDSEIIRSVLVNNELIIKKKETTDPNQASGTPGTLKESYSVVLSNSKHTLGFRSRACNAITNAPDTFDESGKSNLSSTTSTGPNGLGELIGKLPVGAEVEVLAGASGAVAGWSRVKVLSKAPKEVIGKVGFVDSIGIKRITAEDAQKLSEGKSAEVASTPSATPTPILDSEVFPSDQAAVQKIINLRKNPPANWHKRAPNKIFTNKKRRMYEVVIELSFEGGLVTSSGMPDPSGLSAVKEKKKEAREIALQQALIHFSRKADLEYVQKLLSNGTGEIAVAKSFFSDENTKNKKLLIAVDLPFEYFNPKALPAAPLPTIKSLIEAGLVSYQYAFRTNEILDNIKKIKRLFTEVIAPGMQEHKAEPTASKIKNLPDIQYQVKKFDEFILRIDNLLSKNGIKFRQDKNDLIEIGLDRQLKIVYVRFAPEDGQRGTWSKAIN